MFSEVTKIFDILKQNSQSPSEEIEVDYLTKLLMCNYYTSIYGVTTNKLPFLL